MFYLISFCSFLYIQLGYLFTTIQYILSLIKHELSLSFLIIANSPFFGIMEEVFISSEFTSWAKKKIG